MTSRLAIVHDYLVQYGGAERVVEEMHRIWPEAPIYTSLYEPRGLPASFADMDIRTSPLQRLPWKSRTMKAALPLYPAAFRSLDLDDYDVVVSSSSAWAHGARPRGAAAHVVYCYTPPRWLHRPRSYSPVERTLTAPLRPPMRRWDIRAATRADSYIAISSAVRDRVRAVYDRDARVLHPPVDTARFTPGSPEEWFLCASRLNRYKRVDLVIEACRRIGRPLLVAGTGPDRARLERLAGPHVRFLGFIPDDELASLFARCRAFVVPAEEDFCIAAVEATAAGRPVVAFGRGGALDTIVPGTTGVFFDEQTPEAVAAAFVAVESLPVDSGTLVRHARRFDAETFRTRLRDLVEEAAR